MAGPGVLNISNYGLVTAMLVLFGLLGFRRGVSRELISLIGIGMGMLLATALAPKLTRWVNMLYQVVRFILGGGLGAADPVVVWDEASALPPLIRTSADEQLLALSLFILIVLIAYAWGQSAAARPQALLLRVLGAVAGAINGFLLAYYLFPIVFSRPSMVINVPSSQMQETLKDSQNIAIVIVVFVTVLISLGLYNASGPRKRG